MRKQLPLSMPRQAPMLLLALLVSAALGGCALQPQGTASGSVMAGSAQGKPLEGEVSDFLSRANSGEIIQLNQSPWGGDVEVETGSPYYAASGRVCRMLAIRQGGLATERREIACETASGGWVTRRQVTASHTSASRGGMR